MRIKPTMHHNIPYTIPPSSDIVAEISDIYSIFKHIILFTS